MNTYNFNDCRIRVIDCSSAATDFRVAEVYTLQGKFAYEIRTSRQGLKAAALAYAEAKRFRAI